MNIKEYRKAFDMTQKDFAKYICVPVGTLRNWEQGISQTPSVVLRLLDLFYLQVKYCMFDEFPREYWLRGESDVSRSIEA